MNYDVSHTTKFSQANAAAQMNGILVMFCFNILTPKVALLVFFLKAVQS